MHSLSKFYKGKSVLVTGHSGFKGSWLTQWLVNMGAKVTGVSNHTPTTPALSQILKLSASIEEHWIDVRNSDALRKLIIDTQVDVVFHLAAQPIVLSSYESPVETFQSNTLGTIHLLDALRSLKKPCSAVFITSDKCYENRNCGLSFRETDNLGGKDPYSASKACAEIAIAAYRDSYFHPNKDPLVGIASARAGNVIGGGDWSAYRIFPDCVRHLSEGKPIPVRNPHSVRPWQHVLEPLAGYLLLGQQLGVSLGMSDASIPNPLPLETFAGAFNFGPRNSESKNTNALVQEILKSWPGTWTDCSSQENPPEDVTLALCSDKANTLLGWKPVLTFEQSIRLTSAWYRNYYDSISDPIEFTQTQIRDYQAARANNPEL